MAQHKRRLRNYLLDWRYQLRYTLVIVLISSALTAGLGYFWYDEMRTASRILEVKALATMSEGDVKEVQQELASKDHTRLLILVGFGVLLTFVLAGYGIVITHKVAGPLFKMTRHMGEIREGQLGQIWGLRKGDQLQDFWGGFKGMHTALRERLQRDVEALDATIAAAEQHLGQAPPDSGGDQGAYRSGPGDLAGQLEVLRTLRDEKKRSLGS